MFNLVKHRYWFLAVSLIVIIPGLISLIVFGLNVGTDFRGGSSINLRPQTTLTDKQIHDMIVAPLGLKDAQVVRGTDAKIAAGTTAWIKLNTQIDNNVNTALQNALDKKYSDTKLTYDVRNLTDSGEKPYTLITISGFKSPPNESDIKDALKNLPKTTGATVTASATPTAAATPGTTPTAQATPAATGTPTATGTPAATPTATPAPTQGTIDVNVDEVKIGTTAQSINIITLTSIKATKSDDKSAITTDTLQETILQHGGPYVQILDSTEIGGTIAQQTEVYAVLAVLASSVLILLYVWFAFRKIPKAWRYGACAIIALLHDVLVVLGVFSILGHFFAIQIDALFITALLTVVGFSVHDTIVVFDRIRENMRRRSTESFDEVVNASLIQTMARSLNTSLTVLFTLLALTLFTSTSPTVHTFTLTLLIGIFSGTYSSIFNASMLLVIWENGELRFNRKRNAVATADGRREKRELASTRS
ncbi:protein translocase subunit SecF [Tengunoibacter tsumagoiensis]|uniref:Protein-export membrane protein SecF n=1 Tax=Tengunoibacter tsumagoiensis TaxID=2014871 RepID=A0A401ZXI8_9CHLR|nr:protein translocase subunit SecF [Tengunoibacter tsumagoiensis]GCE11552.1 hypothetical protein KTT_14110 [Tengunoibacter tsumagoiensis]